MDCEFTGRHEECDGLCEQCYFYLEWLKWN